MSLMMKCPDCGCRVWALVVSADKKYRCAPCRDEANRALLAGAMAEVVKRSDALPKPLPPPPKPEQVIAERKRKQCSKRPYSKQECRRLNLCIDCCQPAKFYGDVGGYGLYCDEHSRIKAMKQRARHVREKVVNRGGIVPRFIISPA